MTDSEYYWQATELRLHHGVGGAASIDEAGAARYDKAATAPGHYVQQLQRDLIATGYLKAGDDDGAFGNGTRRAVQRFQRRAASSALRLSAAGAVSVNAAYVGAVNGICDVLTAAELRIWIAHGWSAPFGIYTLTDVPGGRLRSDVAKAWEQARADFATLGGVLQKPYGDTARSLYFKDTGGNSRFSLHYTGRAIDIDQGLAGGAGQRYFVSTEALNSDTYWRIYCTAAKQDGTQGKQLPKGTKYFSMWKKSEHDLPAGYYIDLTEFLSARGFSRIRAHSNWKKSPKGMEWWHFHDNSDLQGTFGEEMELLGISEEVLRSKGWATDALIDHPPG